MGVVAYCVAGRGGTAAAEKAEGEEEADSSGSPSSCSEESGGGSMDGVGLDEEAVECLGRTEKDLERGDNTKVRRKTKGNGEREAKESRFLQHSAVRAIRFPRRKTYSGKLFKPICYRFQRLLRRFYIGNFPKMPSGRWRFR